MSSAFRAVKTRNSKVKFFVWIFLFFSISSICFSQQKAQSFTPYQAYFDSVELDQQVTVYSKAGLNWKICTQVFDKVTKKMKCKEAVGWPSRDAKITVISPPERANTIDPFEEDEEKQKITETYVQVEFEYDRVGADGKMYHQKGTGFVELYRLSRSAHNPFFGAQPGKQEICPPASDKKDPNKPLKDLEQAVLPLKNSIKSLDIVQTADKLNSVVGFCPQNPSSSYPKNLSAKKNPYDQLICHG